MKASAKPRTRVRDRVREGPEGAGSPRPLRDAQSEIAARLAAAPRLAVLSDFDGTLAAIRRDPTRVRMSVGVREALTHLAADPDTLVGVISGRGLADIRRRVGLSGICYVGCHGYLMQDSRGHVISLINRDERAHLTRVRRSLVPKLRRLRGIRIERKEAGFAVHYRNATREAAAEARALIDEVFARDTGLHLLAGEKVWEILPGPRVDKWTAISLLLMLENHADSLLIYIGDDVTDEHVFSRMHGISIVVGRDKRTTADYFVDSPSDVRQFLNNLAEHGHGTAAQE
jgi:trehalose-phosphatase